jgi:O-acetylhomoserine/O-acetylserine sulfhydrylase-like pyridoxal-dependent enzyme
MDQLDRIFAREEEGPSYARYDNPTRTALESLVNELESGHGAIACASGMSGLHMAILSALLDRPKRVIAANALYGATTNMLLNIFGPMGSTRRSPTYAISPRSKRQLRKRSPARS